MLRKKASEISSDNVDLRLWVNNQLCDQLNNISDNAGIEFPRFMLQQLRRIEESFPPTYKAKSRFVEIKKKPLRLRKVSKTLIINLENIAENLGLDFDEFIKQQLSLRVQSFPPEMRRPIILFPSERGRRS